MGDNDIIQKIFQGGNVKCGGVVVKTASPSGFPTSDNTLTHTCPDPTGVQSLLTNKLDDTDYIVNVQNLPSNQIDDVSNALIVIEFPHHEIHEGDHFVVTASATVNSTETLNLVLKTPTSTRQIHMWAEARSNKEAAFVIVESPTVTVGTGTKLPIYNRNRNSNNVSVILEDASGTGLAATMNVMQDATFTDGTNIYIEDFGTGKAAGGISRDDSEFILGTGLWYAFQITASENTSNLNLKLDWYEHIPSN